MKQISNILVLLSISAHATFGQSRPVMEFPRWAPSAGAAVVHDFETDLDNGGSFAVDRYFAEGGISRMWSFDRMVTLSAGFGVDDYRFSNTSVSPWNNIENQRIGLFARWALDDQWTLFAGPSLRTYYETGADISDAWTAAFFSGASYRFNEKLSFGPGFGVVGQLEDDPRYFPVLVIRWAVTGRLQMQTGGGFGSSGGPGFTINYALSKKWEAAVTTRYERKRFRLDGDGPVPDGVGEDRNIPVFTSVSYKIYPKGIISAFIGLNSYGKLSLNDGSGKSISSNEYDMSTSLGLMSDFRF